MRTRLNNILKDIVDSYDNAADEQSKANALVLIQTALVNLQNWNNVELGTINIRETKKELASKK
jgi:hypothetical protein